MAGIHGETWYESVEKACLNKKRPSSSSGSGGQNWKNLFMPDPIWGATSLVSYPKVKVLTDVMRKTFTRFGAIGLWF
jgi:hypothetical protein